MVSHLKLATVGTGYFAQFHYEAWSRIKNVNLVGLCTLDNTMGRNIADRFDVETVHDDVADMLDAVEPDLLDIATPPSTHLRFIEAAVARGGAQVEDGWGTAWLTLGCVGIAMTAASTLFVHRIYTGKLGDSRGGSSRTATASRTRWWLGESRRATPSTTSPAARARRARYGR